MLTFVQREKLIGRPFKAWTGGCSPKPIIQVSREERKAISIIFRDQMVTWFEAWYDIPTRNTMRIFWRRARYDAHATFRH